MKKIEFLYLMVVDFGCASIYNFVRQKQNEILIIILVNFDLDQNDKIGHWNQLCKKQGEEWTCERNLPQANRESIWRSRNLEKHDRRDSSIVSSKFSYSIWHICVFTFVYCLSEFSIFNVLYWRSSRISFTPERHVTDWSRSDVILCSFFVFSLGKCLGFSFFSVIIPTSTGHDSF